MKCDTILARISNRVYIITSHDRIRATPDRVQYARSSFQLLPNHRKNVCTRIFQSYLIFGRVGTATILHLRLARKRCELKVQAHYWTQAWASSYSWSLAILNYNDFYNDDLLCKNSKRIRGIDPQPSGNSVEWATPAVLLSPRISRSTIRSEISTLLTSFNERVIIARNVHDIN